MFSWKNGKMRMKMKNGKRREKEENGSQKYVHFF